MINKAILMGRLTRDPELRHTGSGTPVCSFSIAVNRRFRNAEGNYDADFINCVSFGKTAEFAEKYFIELRHRWTLEEFIELSQKYKSYTEFRENEIKAFSTLSNHKDWRDEIKKLFNENN